MEIPGFGFMLECVPNIGEPLVDVGSHTSCASAREPTLLARRIPRLMSQTMTLPQSIRLKFSFEVTKEEQEHILTLEPMRIKLPSYPENIPIEIQANFPDGGVSNMKAVLRRVWGANLRQQSPTHAFVQFQHGVDGQCKVWCPTTGKELVGTNPCILCPTASGDVLEICC